MLHLETGQEVLYKNEKWNVLYVWRNSDNVVVRISLVRLEFKDVDGVGTTWRQKRVDASPEEISECKHELTAKEYAEKLREYFGIEDPPGTHGKLCAAVNCKECAFYEEPAWCEAAVMLFDPAAGMERIQAQNHKDKPKGKTYLEDFREKFPNCVLCSDGTPALCRCEAYGGNCERKDDPTTKKCVHCWNEVMPEEEK